MNYDPNELVVVFSNVTCLAVAASAAVAAPIRTNSELIRTISELNEPAFFTARDSLRQNYVI